MTTLERALAALDEVLILQVKGAADAAWLRVTGKQPLAEAGADFARELVTLFDLHDALRVAVADKFK